MSNQLPIQKKWVKYLLYVDTDRLPLMPGEHVYNNIHWTSNVSQEKLQNLNKFDVQADDIYICSYPKSGK